MICQHVARGRETENIVKCLLRYSCISRYICALALSLVYLYSLQLLKTKLKNPLDKPRKTHPTFPFFSLPLCTNLKDTERGAAQKLSVQESPGLEEERSKAELPGGSMKGEGGGQQADTAGGTENYTVALLQRPFCTRIRSRIQNLRSFWCWCR